MRNDPIVLDDADATLQLLQATQAAAGAAERGFVLLNRSRDVWPYQSAVLWRDGRVAGHSGVGQVDRHGPYAQWVGRLVAALRDHPPGVVTPDTLPTQDAALREAWQEYWPPYLLWLPMGTAAAQALLLARDLPWTERDARAVARWWTLWHEQDRQATRAEAATGPGTFGAWRRHLHDRKTRVAAAAAAVLLAVLAWPVTLTVRAPGELVPREPLVLRAAVDGTVRALKVEPNQAVKAGQLLVEFDDAQWHTRLEVARQALLTADAEWRQVSQQALNDPRAKSQLAAAQGKVEERQAEVAFLTEQTRRSALVAPQDGVVLIQDAGTWPGRTVAAGEAVLKIAQPTDQEVEAWLPVGDAVNLPDRAPMTLHLTNRPAQPLHAQLRLYAFEAETRPDHGLGYRLRGTLTGPATERLGARGTVRIEGERVPLAYWVLRRPLAALREATGW